MRAPTTGDPAAVRVAAFSDLHREGIFLLPNAWDVGSARVLADLGFAAIATTSSGYARSRGRGDGDVPGAEMLAHAAELVGAVAVPVSADLENCYADDPDGVADTVREAVAAGLAGASIEDWSGTAIYPRDVAVERVRAACEAAGGNLIITARAENHLRGVDDLDDTIARLQAYQDAGAHVLYAPFVGGAAEIRALVSGVDLPVNVLQTADVPPVAELAELGVRRVSVGGAFAHRAYDALAAAARDFRASLADG